jgi:F-type H+-transporting ATPase subunit c
MKSIVSLSLRTTALLALSTGIAFAQDGGGGPNWGPAVGAGLAIGLAAAGGGVGQGLGASAGLSGIGRNPDAYDKIFTPMLIGLAFVESLVLLAFVMAFLLKP